MRKANSEQEKNKQEDILEMAQVINLSCIHNFGGILFDDKELIKVAKYIVNEGFGKTKRIISEFAQKLKSELIPTYMHADPLIACGVKKAIDCIDEMIKEYDLKRAKMSCVNCKNFTKQERGGYCSQFHKPITNYIAFRPCAVLNITCPYCGSTIIMDWRCKQCGKEIAYDIDKYGVRSNPHKKGEEQ